MSFLEIAVEFLKQNDVWFLSGAFAVVWLFAIANWCKNCYRKQNKKLDECRRKIAYYPNVAAYYLSTIPTEYRRQWRAFVSSKASSPARVFEFVPHKNKVLFLRLFVLAAVVSTCYMALFVLDVSHREYAVYQIAFWMSFSLSIVVNEVLFDHKEKRARRIFGQFVAQLNNYAANKHEASPKSTQQQLSELKRSGFVDDDAIARASAILREHGLENPRSVAEQQKINFALNGLLQAYARSAAKKQVEMRKISI